VVLAATEQEIRVSFASDSDGVAEIQRFLEQQQIHQAA
jgi:hypothetical protein